MSEPIRLSKRVVELTGCSRTEAEQYVEEGWVKVDGTLVEEPQRMVSTEVVEIDPNAVLAPKEPATFLLSKPAGLGEGEARALLVPAGRSADDASGIRPLSRHMARLAEALPLEPFGSGLVVFTQDPRVARRLLEDADRIEQEIIADVTGEIARRGLELLSHGLGFEGRAVPPMKVSWQNEGKLRFAIKQPRPGQIAHMCREVGLELVGLKRIRIGRIPLKKMPEGAWRYLPVTERF